MTITVDSVFEKLEKFSVALSADKHRLEVKRYYASVYIIEDRGK